MIRERDNFFLWFAIVSLPVACKTNMKLYGTDKMTRQSGLTVSQNREIMNVKTVRHTIESVS